MASSGTYGFNPTVAEIVDEAFERCGLDPAALTGRHAQSARRSINLLIADWSTRKRYTFKGIEDTITLTQGTVSYALDTGVHDVGQMMLKRGTNETPMIRISRDDYRMIFDKTIQGRPSVYFVDRLIAPTLKIWQAPENSTDQLVFNQYLRIEDVLTAAETFGVPHRWLEALTADIAKRLAVKWAPDRYQLLAGEAMTTYRSAENDDDDNADLDIVVKLA